MSDAGKERSVPSLPVNQNPDIEDRRGKKPTFFAKVGAKVGELKQAVKDDYSDMKQAQADKASGKSMQDRIKSIPSYKNGGVVKKTGLALVHKGERVIPVGGKMKNFFLNDEDKVAPDKNPSLPKPGFRKSISGKRGAMSVNGGQIKAGYRKASGKR